MENASKALIIAGAILVSILLIGIGVALVNSLSGVTENAGDTTTSTAIQTFNNNFTRFTGKQSGSNVLSLLSTIRTHNVSTQTGKVVQVVKGGTWKKADGSTDSFTVSALTGNNLTPVKANTELTKMEKAVIKSHSYGVAVSYDTEGYVDKVTITY